MHFVRAKSILSKNNGMNLYRGCLHGCIYCDSRSLCYHMDHVFEDIQVKENAIELLEAALKRKRRPCMIGTGSMTDPYLPLEQELQLTRQALDLIYQYGFGVTLLTKSDLVLRDLELLQKINQRTKAVVQMTLTTMDESLCKRLEPQVSTTAQRIEALRQFQQAGIPTIVWLSPILPHLNDTRENIQGILEACIQLGVKGVICFNMGLTLRDGNREYFYAQLDRHFPGLKQRYIQEFGNQYELNSPQNAQLMELFHSTCAQAGLMHDVPEIFQYLHQFESSEPFSQISFF